MARSSAPKSAADDNRTSPNISVFGHRVHRLGCHVVVAEMGADIRARNVALRIGVDAQHGDALCAGEDRKRIMNGAHRSAAAVPSDQNGAPDSRKLPSIRDHENRPAGHHHRVFGERHIASRRQLFLVQLPDHGQIGVPGVPGDDTPRPSPSSVGHL
jgi:hypothetical protein